MRDPRRVEIHAIRHERGCRSYVVVDPRSRDAIVVDPLLTHVRETLDAVQERRGKVRWIVDTHPHGDHLSGAAALHQRLGADVVMHPEADSQVATVRAEDGQRFPLGEHAMVIHHAPGISAAAVVVEVPGALLTGDTLLIGTVGIRDAPGADGDAWFDTFERIFRNRDDETVLHPGHDDMGRSMTTLRAERTGNRWLREDDREAFLDLFASDDRRAAKEAERILDANRQGMHKVPRDLAAHAGFRSPVEVEEATRREERAPLESGEPPPTRGGSDHAGLLVLCGILTAGGTIAGWLWHPGAHGASLLAALILLAVGLPAMERRRKRRARARGDLYYQGAPPDVVT